MLESLREILSVDSLSPHGICLLWRPELIWLHAVSDAVIGAAYFSIPIVLAVFVSKRPDVGFHWVFWAFALFILACGTTHFLSIWTLWVPDYGAEGMVKALTATVSIATAVALWPMLPRALAVPSPAQLRDANEVLRESIRDRDRAMDALRAETMERERTEAMLRQAQKMEAIGQLTGGLAHDFNNLLTVVIGNLEMIGKRTTGDEDLTRGARNATAAASRAATLTHQLLAFARKQPLQSADVDANELVRTMIDFLGSTLGEHVRVEVELAPELGLLHVDRNQLENALLNLAVNAKDAMPDGGVLTFRTKPGGQDRDGPATVVLEVSDTGTGMDPELTEKAFEPFFTTKPLGKGSGLGLSQVHGFVSQSKGRVAVVSAPGVGTTVRIELPAQVKPGNLSAGSRHVERV